MIRSSYDALTGPGSATLVVRRSRFFAYADAAAGGDGVREWIGGLRRRHPDARHVPHAWVDGDGTPAASDDGEPAGTGGRPCLAALRRRGLCGSAVAVVRIFGGVQLGAANLGRAYGQAAEAAVAAAPVATIRVETLVEVEASFADSGHVERLLARRGGRVVQRAFDGAGARLCAWLDPEAAAALRAELPRARVRLLRGPGAPG